MSIVVSIYRVERFSAKLSSFLVRLWLGLLNCQAGALSGRFKADNVSGRFLLCLPVPIRARLTGSWKVNDWKALIISHSATFSLVKSMLIADFMVHSFKVIRFLLLSASFVLLSL